MLPIMLYEPGRAARRPPARPPPCRFASPCSPPLSARPCSPRSPPAAAVAAPHVPGEVIVRYGGAHAASPAPSRARGCCTSRTSRGPSARCASGRDVLSATPNYIAHTSGWVPPDPGNAGVPGGWQNLQWNFMPGTGVDAPDAWVHLAQAGHPGGKGVTVAVLDTGVAYANRGRFRRSPDLSHEALRPRLELRRQRSLPQRRQRPRHARRQHDRRGHGQHDRPHRPRLRRQADAGQGARPHRRGRLLPDRQRHPLRRRPRREGHQPLVRVPVGDHRRPDPEHPRRDPPRPQGRRARRRRLRQRRGRRRRLPGPLERRPLRRRHHPARLPGRLLQRGHRPRHRRPRRRRRRRPPGRPQLPPERPARAWTSSR